MKTILGDMPAEEFARCGSAEKQFLRSPGRFAVSYAIMLVGIAGITLVCCKMFNLIEFLAKNFN